MDLQEKKTEEKRLREKIKMAEKEYNVSHSFKHQNDAVLRKVRYLEKIRKLWGKKPVRRYTEPCQ